MYRTPNTTRNGFGFDLATINAVWAKATIVPGNDAAVIRKDSCGAWIKRVDYGKTTEYGWEIDHIQPVAKNGTDELYNLQPLHWQNNRHKSDNWPSWSCAVKAA